MSLSREELAERAGVPEATVDHFVELTIMVAADSRSFTRSDA